MNARQAEHRESVITELQYLLEVGEWPPRIAARLNYKDVSSLRETMIRWQQKDLAFRLRRDRWDHLSAEPRNQHMAARRG